MATSKLVLQLTHRKNTSKHLFSDSVLRLNHVYMLFGSVYCPNVIHCLFSLVCHQLSFTEANSGTIVVALNIRWNLIYLKSQGNQSLLRAEWLSSLQPLTGRDVASQEKSHGCAGITSKHSLGLCLKQNYIFYSNFMYFIFNTLCLWILFDRILVNILAMLIVKSIRYVHLI